MKEPESMIEEITQRWAMATPGPWRAVWDSRPDVIARIRTVDGKGGYFDEGELVHAIHRPTRNQTEVMVACLSKYENACIDAEAVAHAPEDVAFLLAENARLQGKIVTLRAVERQCIATIEELRAKTALGGK